jgi:hypothetical protein
MATSRTKPGTGARRKAARPIQNRSVGRRAPAAKRMRDDAPTQGRPFDSNDESLIARFRRQGLDTFDDDGEGSER